MEQQEQSGENTRKRSWKKWIIGIVIVFVIFAILAVLQRPREITVAEADLNETLTEGMNNNQENPLVKSEIDLEEDIGFLTLQWEKGQELTADIVVSQNGLLLVAENVDVTGAEPFNEVFEGVAHLILSNVLTTASISQRNLSALEIVNDALVVRYGRR